MYTQYALSLQQLILPILQLRTNMVMIPIHSNIVLHCDVLESTTYFKEFSIWFIENHAYQIYSKETENVIQNWYQK